MGLVLVRQLSLGPKGRPELSSHSRGAPAPWTGWRSSYTSWEPALRHAMQASQELAAVGDPGPRADATDIEPDAQPARRDHRRVRRQVDILGDCRPREPVHAAARRHGGPPGAEGPARCPRSPVGCFAIPDAISQLEALDRQLLTRQDVERLFRRSARLRAAALMQTFGAELVGNQRNPAPDEDRRARRGRTPAEAACGAGAGGG